MTALPAAVALQAVALLQALPAVRSCLLGSQHVLLLLLLLLLLLPGAAVTEQCLCLVVQVLLCEQALYMAMLMCTAIDAPGCSC
jgi:hypothetical protein